MAVASKTEATDLGNGRSLTGADECRERVLGALRVLLVLSADFWCIDGAGGPRLGGTTTGLVLAGTGSAAAGRQRPGTFWDGGCAAWLLLADGLLVSRLNRKTMTTIP